MFIICKNECTVSLFSLPQWTFIEHSQWLRPCGGTWSSVQLSRKRSEIFINYFAYLRKGKQSCEEGALSSSWVHWMTITRWGYVSRSWRIPSVDEHFKQREKSMPRCRNELKIRCLWNNKLFSFLLLYESLREIIKLKKN